MTPPEPWILTYTGKAFHPLRPDAEEIDIHDIAHHLSLLCRFAGACKTFYSVAEHSLRVVAELEKRGAGPVTLLWGLLHDAPEAWINDITRPVKTQPEMAEYRRIESSIMLAVCKRFALPRRMPPIVDQIDKVLLATEARDLMNDPDRLWRDHYEEPLRHEIRPIEDPATVESTFLRVFEVQTRKRRDPHSIRETPKTGGS